MGCGKYGRAFLHSLSTEQLINPELNQPMNQKIMGAAHFLDIIRPVEYKLTSQKSSRLSDLPTSSSVPCDLSFYLYLSVSQSESSFLSLPRSLPRSFNLSPTETWSETKKPSSSTEAKPEITAPILDSFPASLPPATACGAQTGFPAHRYSESSPWFFHDRLVAKRPRIQTTTFKISCCASRFFFFFLIHQDFCLGFLSVPSTLLTPGRCNLKMWRFFPWRQVMNARHFHLQSAEELIVPKNKVIFNLKLRSLTTKTIKQGCRY